MASHIQGQVTTSNYYTPESQNIQIHHQDLVHNSAQFTNKTNSYVFPNPNTPGLPLIPHPSSLGQFGSLTLSATIPPNTNSIQIYNPPSITPKNPIQSQMYQSSQKLSLSAFPIAHLSQYNSGNISTPVNIPRDINQIAYTQNKTSNWVWIIIIILIIILGLIGYMFYHKYKQQPSLFHKNNYQFTTLPQSFSYSNRQKIYQNKIRQVQSIDQDHHNHFRYYLS